MKSRKFFAVAIGSFVVFLASLRLPSYAVDKNDKPKEEAYSGVAIGTGGALGGRSMQFDFRITRYTTDEELEGFAKIVREKGTDALRRELARISHASERERVPTKN